ncbi:acyl-CoA dehydrogenase [Legionella waltersii]|uniref:Isovaleryl CoA dehydrogenase n=1 Tax=Legionella waltersii TaxID=66969 RepID=A0A0W0ZZU5_9GAMM|nr:acyl-CoA dehydrogenase family protein [Legionella waltersii]KTD74625.1 isovaleryl CoA dehydrogenase [Legionella waltersii]SNV08872.1 isovaleryl CoA dehydrogenase [Legionella waltersii]
MPPNQKWVLLLESLENTLGSPHDKQSPVNFEQSLDYDEHEALPWSQVELIQKWGFMDYLIPENLGGKLHGLDDLYGLTKLIARRDITTAIALGLSFLAALPTWLAGSKKQKEQLAGRLRQGEIGAFALTEEEHGSDLTANEVTAISNEQGWVLSGEKWCINFATLGHSVTVLCRTHEKAGLRGFSLFYFDKSNINQGFSPTPKLPTHGVRGLDISGFCLDKLLVQNDALIGKEGKGLEIIYKTFQVSRTLCASLSVGGADTALRLALSFSLKRQLYNKRAYDLPVVKQKLSELFVTTLITDCISLVVARASTVAPEYMSLWSAVIKYFVPKTTSEIVENCAIILGARAYLRSTEWGIFQKIRRDIQIVGLFDGSSQVNLSIITGHLLAQAELRDKSTLKKPMDMDQLFNLEKECPAFEGDQFSLFTTKEDLVLSGIKQLQSQPLNNLIHQVVSELKMLDAHLLGLRDAKAYEPRSIEAFDLADKYCRLFAASCCLQFWFYNQKALSQELQNTEWLHLAVALLLKNTAKGFHDEQIHEKMSDVLLSYFQDNKLFSVCSVRIKE